MAKSSSFGGKKAAPFKKGGGRKTQAEERGEPKGVGAKEERGEPTTRKRKTTSRKGK